MTQLETFSKVFSSFPGLGAFFGGKKSAVAVEFSDNILKIIELALEKEKFLVKNYAIVNLEEESFRQDSKQTVMSFTGKVVKEILEKNGFENVEEVNICIPGSAAFITSFSVFCSDLADLNAIVQAELPKYIPVPIEDVVYGWQADKLRKINYNAGNSQESDRVGGKEEFAITMVALMKDISKNYEEVFGKSGLVVNLLETDIFCLMESLAGDFDGSFVIFDIGREEGKLIFGVNRKLVASKIVQVSEKAIVESIARFLRISKERAFQIKNSDQNNEVTADLKKEIFSLLLADSIKELQTRIKQDDKKPSGIILSGVGSIMPGLKEYIAEQTGLKVVYGNPWNNVSFSSQTDDFKKNLPYLGLELAAVCGLAKLALNPKSN